MSTQKIYVALEHSVKPMAFGVEPFNSSVATQLGVMQDMFFNLGYVSFLSNPLHAIDITPDSARREGCAKGMGLRPDQSCLHRVLITQELQNVNANLPLSHDSDSQVILSAKQQIYSLDFHDNIEVVQEKRKCKDLNAGPASYILCAGDAEDGAVLVTMVPCPASFVVNQKCLNDTSWRLSRGFSTSLRASYVHASVAYQRLDGRILWHEEQSDPQLAKVEALDLLEALGVILTTDNRVASPLTPENSNGSAEVVPSNPILGSPTHFFGRLVAGHMYRISRLKLSTDIEAHWRGTNALQNLLAITLFYCQNGILSQTVLPFLFNSSAITDFYGRGVFEQPKKSSLVSFADTRYKLKVGRATLHAYISLSGLTLLICMAVLITGSLLELMSFDAEPTLWPCLDFYTQCRVEDDKGKIMPAHKRVELAWTYDGRQMFREINCLRVRRRKRQTRPLELDAQRAEDG